MIASVALLARKNLVFGGRWSTNIWKIPYVTSFHVNLNLISQMSLTSIISAPTYLPNLNKNKPYFLEFLGHIFS